MRSFLTETGYRKPPNISNKFEMCSILKQYHTITKVKAELDQFSEGLEAMGVLQMMKREKDAMKVFFIQTAENKLTRGNNINISTRNF